MGFRFNNRNILAVAIATKTLVFKTKHVRRVKRFKLEDISDYDARHWFRFNKADIGRLRLALLIPDSILTSNRDKVTGTEALCILLRRFAYPNRLFESCKMFHRSPASFSNIFNFLLDFIYIEHKHLLSGIKAPWMQQNDLEMFAESIASRNAPLRDCVGFIDGTMRATCRPGKHQKVAYSGHKRQHGIKFQGVIFPNGIAGHLYGPIEGRRHDAGMLKESKLLDELEEHFRRADGSNFYLYGDAAYPVSRYLLGPFKGAIMAGGMKEWNRSMSSVRQAIEWGFGIVIALFAFLDFKKNQKIYLQAVGKNYIVGVILTNCHNTLYHNQVSKYFNLPPPTIEQYLTKI